MCTCALFGPLTPRSLWTPHWSPSSRKGRSRPRKGDKKAIKEKLPPVGMRGRSGSDRATLILLRNRIKAWSDRRCGLMGDQKSSGNAKGNQTPQFASETVVFWTHFRSQIGGSMRDHTQVGTRQRFQACNLSCCGIPISKLWIQWERGLSMWAHGDRPTEYHTTIDVDLCKENGQPG